MTIDNSSADLANRLREMDAADTPHFANDLMREAANFIEDHSGVSHEPLKAPEISDYRKFSYEQLIAMIEDRDQQLARAPSEANRCQDSDGCPYKDNRCAEFCFQQHHYQRPTETGDKP